VAQGWAQFLTNLGKVSSAPPPAPKPSGNLHPFWDAWKKLSELPEEVSPEVAWFEEDLPEEAEAAWGDWSKVSFEPPETISPRIAELADAFKAFFHAWSNQEPSVFGIALQITSEPFYKDRHWLVWGFLNNNLGVWFLRRHQDLLRDYTLPFDLIPIYIEAFFYVMQGKRGDGGVQTRPISAEEKKNWFLNDEATRAVLRAKIYGRARDTIIQRGEADRSWGFVKRDNARREGEKTPPLVEYNHRGGREPYLEGGGVHRNQSIDADAWADDEGAKHKERAEFKAKAKELEHLINTRPDHAWILPRRAHGYKGGHRKKTVREQTVIKTEEKLPRDEAAIEGERLLNWQRPIGKRSARHVAVGERKARSKADPYMGSERLMVDDAQSTRSLLSKELTPRQYAIVVLRAQGYTNDKVGKKLGIAPSTVARHMMDARENPEAQRLVDELEGEDLGRVEEPKGYVDRGRVGLYHSETIFSSILYYGARQKNRGLDEELDRTDFDRGDVPIGRPPDGRYRLSRKPTQACDAKLLDLVQVEEPTKEFHYWLRLDLMQKDVKRRKEFDARLRLSQEPWKKSFLIFKKSFPKLNDRRIYHGFIEWEGWLWEGREREDPEWEDDSEWEEWEEEDWEDP